MSKVRNLAPPSNTSNRSSAGPLKVERLPVDGSLLNWIAGFVPDSMKPAGVPRVFNDAVLDQNARRVGPDVDARVHTKRQRLCHRSGDSSTEDDDIRRRALEADGDRVAFADRDFAGDPETVADAQIGGRCRTRRRCESGPQRKVWTSRPPLREKDIHAAGEGVLAQSTSVLGRRRTDQRRQQRSGAKQAAEGWREAVARRHDGVLESFGGVGIGRREVGGEFRRHASIE